jgi:nitroreductase
MELRDVMRSTPATRDFLPDPVPDEVLFQLLDTARFAPNGGNRQSWRVVVLKDPAVRAAVRDLYVLGEREYNAYRRAKLVPFAPGDDARWHGYAVDVDAARDEVIETPFAKAMDTAPVLLAVFADATALACTDNGLERQSIVGGGSVYPFCHNILLAARDVGLGGVMTTILARQEPAVRELLGVPLPYIVASLMPIGRPVQQLTKLRRAAVEEFATVDHFGGEPFRPPSP